MGTMDYFRSAARDFHNRFYTAIDGLTAEQLHFMPLDRGNHIAFMIWHLVRTEDAVINLLLQKKPTVWTAEGWDKKFGMDPMAQGTGMTSEEASAIRIDAPAEFLNYVRSTFKATEDYLQGVVDEELDREEEFQFLGKRSLYQVIGGVILQHIAGHLAEIYYVKGLQGLQGSPI